MRHVQRMMALTVLAAGVGFAVSGAQIAKAADEENATVKTNPGFDQSGKLNPGETHQVPSASPDKLLPTPEQSRKAIMMPDPKDPVAGKPAAQAAAQENQPSATTGSAPAESANWPIGSTGQTAPAKFSERNDILDRTPMMAVPMQLSDADRTRIFKDVMADKTQPSADAAKLKPADELSTEQAFNDMHPLPQSLADVEWIKKLQYVKAKDKVFLVEPSTRIVVDQIAQ